jgi:hypothetical protein
MGSPGQAKVAVGGEGAHAELGSEREGFMVAGVRGPAIHGLGAGGELGETSTCLWKFLCSHLPVACALFP